MAYLCKHGHKHRTETAVEFCHLATPWRELESTIETVQWDAQGTIEEWSDLGRFRPLFWDLMRYHILKRDRVCQYAPCGIFHEQSQGGGGCHILEVHHIVPRRLGGTDHPRNLISLCHDHHRTQPAHHYDAGLVACDADIPKTPFAPRRIRQARPETECTLADFS